MQPEKQALMARKKRHPNNPEKILKESSHLFYIIHFSLFLFSLPFLVLFLFLPFLPFFSSFLDMDKAPHMKDKHQQLQYVERRQRSRPIRGAAEADTKQGEHPSDGSMDYQLLRACHHVHQAISVSSKNRTTKAALTESTTARRVIPITSPKRTLTCGTYRPTTAY